MYWEFINTLRKAAILMSLLFSRTVAIYISIMVLILTARLQVLLKPYKDPENYKVEFLAIMAGVCIIMAALIYSQNEKHDILNAYVFLIIIMVNLKFVIEWIYLILLLYEGKNPLVQYLTNVLGRFLCKKKKISSDTAKSATLGNTTQRDLKNTLKTFKTENQPQAPESGTPKRRVKGKSHKRKRLLNKPPKKKNLSQVPDFDRARTYMNGEAKEREGDIEGLKSSRRTDRKLVQNRQARSIVKNVNLNDSSSFSSNVT